jgi:hypothetical protein
MRRILVGAVVALLSAGAALGPAGAASAAKVVVEDGTSDVFARTWDGAPYPAYGFVFTPAGSSPNIDVVRTTVRHTATAIRYKVEYADLVTSSEASERGISYLRTNYDAWFVLSDGRGAALTVWQDTPETTETFFWRSGTAHPKRQCPGVTGAIDYARNTLTGKVPRSCLGDPAWVSFHGNALAGAPSQAGEDWRDQVLYLDNASAAGYTPDELLKSPDCFTQCEGWTGRIRHG